MTTHPEIEALIQSFGGPARSLEDAEDRFNRIAKLKNEIAAREDPDIQKQAARYWEVIKPQKTTSKSLTRAAKPDAYGGKAAYVWRMVRFHNGEDTHMPITADFDIMVMENDPRRQMPFDSRGRTEWLDESFEGRRNICKHLDKVVDYILNEHFVLRQYSGARRWHDAGLF